MTSPTNSASLEEAQPCGWSRGRVGALASKAAASLGYQPGDDMVALVESLGGEVRTADSREVGDTGSIEVRGPRQFTIFLSPLAGELRSRFTIAHELGHYILHSGAGKKPLFVRRDGSGRVEWEANWFAAGFLMPEDEFRRLMNSGMGDAALAEHFGVSMAAVDIRKKSLGGENVH